MAKIGDDARLFLRNDKTGGDGIELKAQLFPDSKAFTHVFGSVVNIELGVIERIGHQGRRQVMNAITHVREHGQHGRKRHLAIAAHVVDQQKLLGVFHLVPLAIRAPTRRRDCPSVAQRRIRDTHPLDSR